MDREKSIVHDDVSTCQIRGEWNWERGFRLREDMISTLIRAIDQENNVGNS